MTTVTFLYLTSPTVNMQAVVPTLCPPGFCRRNCTPTPPVRTPMTTLEMLTIHMTVKRAGSLSSLLDAQQDGGVAGLQRAGPRPARPAPRTARSRPDHSSVLPVLAERHIPPESPVAPAAQPHSGQADKTPGSHCSEAGVKSSLDQPHPGCHQSVQSVCD